MESTPSADPRPGKPAEWYEVNPQARMSFTRLASHRRCPGWYRYQYLEWHRTWNTPILRAGHVVQGVLERVFDGVPAEDVTFESLEERALARAGILFERQWEQEQRAHEEDPNGHGPWDLPRPRYEGFLRQGIRWHLREVRARLDRLHPRTGESIDLPELSGVAAAWEAVRPWHAPSDALSLESVPGGFFQGEYDLVYSWTGARRIVDLKASSGSSPFSGEIELQLLSYAYMERALGRGRPEGIEAWFLGAEEPRVFDVPEDAELDALGKEVVDLIEVSGSEKGFGEWDPAGFPPEPTQVEGFAAASGDASAWCAYCPASFTCEKSGKEAPAPGSGLDLLDPPETGSGSVQGLVLGVGEPRERADGRVKRRFTLCNRTGTRSFTWDDATVKRLIDAGLRSGRVVRITDLRPWKHPRSGAVMLFDSRTTRLEMPGESPG